ncbi:MAG: hypothetical protein WC325_13315 [Candidatus Bathyarchaeia archaeon]|jgi:prophage maintenance system killer protein
MSATGLTAKEIHDKLIEINKGFNDGTLRYDCIDDLERYTVLEIANCVAEQHPFIDGNKRTAIRFAELMFGDNVPNWVYSILKRA